MALTGRAALAALAGAALILAFRAPALLIAVNVLLLLAIAADLALAAPVRPLRFTRSGDTRCLLGERASVSRGSRWDNPGRRTLRADIRDAWQPSAGALPRQARVRVPAGRQAWLTTVLVPDRRGDKAAAAVTVRSTGPLGLAARQGRHSVPWTVRVLPPFRAAAGTCPGSCPGCASSMASTVPCSAARAVSSTRCASTRRSATTIRSIDWRATARRGDVMVRTWRPERDRQILVMLDTGRTSAGRVGGVPCLDASMDATLLLTALASRAGDRVDMLAFDRRLRARVVGAPRPAALAAVAQAMAVIEPELVETDAAALSSAALTTARHRSLIVLLTDLNPAAIEEGLLPRLPLLAARHEVLVAAVADPALTQLASGRADAASVYGAAAAEQALAARQRVAALLQRQGAHVVDALPDRLPAALADSYLALKAGGRAGTR